MNGSILAVDVGSSSVRAVVSDRYGGEARGSYTQIAYQFERTPDGGATLDPDRVCGLVFECIDQALAKAGDVHIALVAIDTFVTSLVGLGAQDEPVTPLYTWSDARGSDLRPALASRLDGEAYHQRTGCTLHPSYWPLRLLWLKRSAPEVFGQVRRWYTLGGLLIQRIFGGHAVSISDASWTGLLDRRTLTWDSATLDALELPRESLPEITAGALSGLSGAYAGRWSALHGAEWRLPIGDGIASNVGAGCRHPWQVALALGTSGAMRVIVDGAPESVPDGLFCYRVDRQRSLVGGALSNVGSVYYWLTQTLRLDSPELLQTELGQMEPDSHGLTVLPYLTPERSPHWDERIPAALVGMTAATRPLDVLRAGLESVAFGYARILERLRPLLPDTFTITASGGAVSSSPALMQILADVLGQPIQTARAAEASLRGAVLFQTGEAHQAELAATYTPDPSRTAVYAAAMERQSALLARFQGERA